MKFDELIHELECDHGRINFRERLMLRRAYDVVPEKEKEQLEKVKELLVKVCEGYASIDISEEEMCNRIAAVEAFLKELYVCEDRLCVHCDEYKSFPDGKRCRTCDNGSKWKRRIDK